MNQHLNNFKVNKRESQFYQFLFLLIILTLPYSIRLNSASIILFSIYNLWLWLKTKEIDKSAIVFLFVNLSVILIAIVGFINTEHYLPALKYLETRVPLIIFPLILVAIGKFWNKYLLDKVLLTFVLVILLSGLIIQGALLWDLIKEGKSLNLFFYWRNSNDVLADRINIHPTYLSMYALFSIAITYELTIWNKTFTLKTILGYITIIYLSVLTLHLASRVALIPLFIIIIFILVNSIRQFKFYSLFIIIPLLLCGTFLFNLDTFAMTDRYGHSIHSPFEKPDPGTNDDRSVAWYSSIQLIKQNFLVGVGTGDATSELNALYRELGIERLADQNLNSHNQFLDAIVRNGILGILALVLIYFYGVYDTRFNNRLYLLFIIIIAITSMTENILDRQKGAVFFAVFNVLLYKYSQLNIKSLHSSGSSTKLTNKNIWRFMDKT